MEEDIAAARKRMWLELNKDGYLDRLRAIAKESTAPFWWHRSDGDAAQVIHNGTVCIVNTGARVIAVTADHVYEQYLRDIESLPKIVCQFGNFTLKPIDRLIDRSPVLDLAILDVPEFRDLDHIYRPPLGARWPALKL